MEKYTFEISMSILGLKTGDITIDGHNINDIHPEHLLSYYSFVFQDVTLFNDTVFNNIKVGNYQATDEEIYAAAKWRIANSL